MKFILLVFISTISFSASAQWWRLDLQLKKHERFPLIDQVTDQSIARLPVATFNQAEIQGLFLDCSEYNNEAAENLIMKTAQHNMRFRIYNDASYNFSDLAHLYIQQNRFSEAKWFLLQSNIISRQENDDKHTIANLIDLAIVKANTGYYEQAQQDLNEAHELAGIKGLQNTLPEIEKTMLYIKQNKLSLSKSVSRYADFPLNNTKAE
ncbi:MAG: hypothetical protein JWQ63_1392 [Mucilaginibacter sp.]|nr:hypothetical protein [Mucilaginibacter sp.]